MGKFGYSNMFSFWGFGFVLLLFSTLLFGGAYVVQQKIDFQFLSGVYVQLCLLMYFVTLFAYAVSGMGISAGPEMGVYGILGGIILKMLASLGFFLFFLHTFPEENRRLLGLNFIGVYFPMSGLEVVVLLRMLSKSKTGKSP